MKICVCACFQIKTRQVFRQLPQILPRVTGKKAIFVPHLLQTLIVQMTTQICGVSYYCITQSNRFSGASWLSWLQWGLYYHQTLQDSDCDTESGSGRGQTCKQQHLSCGPTACERPELHAGGQSSCVNAAEKRGRVCIHGYL